MATLRRLREAPRHLLVCERSNFSHHKSRHRHLVEAHYHNYRVSFLIPECEILPKQLKSLVKETGPNYCVKNLPLQELIAHEFINTFVRKGLKSLTGAVPELLPLALYHLSQTSMTRVALHCDPLNCDSSLLSSCYALMFNTYIDEDNTVGLLPNEITSLIISCQPTAVPSQAQWWPGLACVQSLASSFQRRSVYCWNNCVITSMNRSCPVGYLVSSRLCRQPCFLERE
ncbi:PREDICTED: ribonuclease P protein subunit p40 [Dipodomys ordii]|uniref:Ribonuclease P protein subunit p40 n=1 Tax=Dipodomys ordii TaxID=10020 RepID=A0A1S3F7P1_DIPOR|nr:PREDICTED: ribonuclease P protein subunit p40 [Dipodomys ordii]